MELKFKEIKEIDIISFYDILNIIDILYYIDKKTYYDLEKKYQVIFDEVKNNNDIIFKIKNDLNIDLILKKAYIRLFDKFINNELDNFFRLDYYDKMEYINYNFDLDLNQMDKIIKSKNNYHILRILLYKKYFNKCFLDLDEYFDYMLTY